MNIYNSIDLADRVIKEDVSEYLPGIADIFKKYDVDEKYCVWRVHRHFELGEDEIMLRNRDMQRAVNVNDVDMGDVYPYTCVIRGGELVPMEFSTMKPEMPSKDFISELDVFLSKHGVSSKLGISLSHNDSEHEINYESGVSKYFPGARSGPTMSVMAWSASDDIVPGKRSCEVVCSGGNGNGQPVHKCKPSS